jgi:transcriptional regulator with PAS, ATPase and Fis domain
MEQAALERGFVDALFGAWPVGMALLDRGLRFVRVNDAMARLTMTPVEDHLGRTVAEVLPSFAGQIEPVLEMVMRERRSPVGQRARAMGVSWDVSMVPIVVDDEVAGVAVYAVDVTSEVEATEALEQQTAVIYDRIVQGLVAAALAHELGVDDILESNLRQTLDAARDLATGSAHHLLDLRDRS